MCNPTYIIFVRYTAFTETTLHPLQAYSMLLAYMYLHGTAVLSPHAHLYSTYTVTHAHASSYVVPAYVR